MLPSSDVASHGSEAHRQAMLARLYAQHIRDVWRWLSLFGVRDADLEDAGHDVFVAAHQSLPSFEGRSSHRTWLFGITRHVGADYARRPYARREQSQSSPDLGPGDDDPERDVAVAQARAILDQILGELTDDQRVTFLLYELGGHTGAVIAELTGVPLQTVYSRLYAAREHVERRSAMYL